MMLSFPYPSPHMIDGPARHNEHNCNHCISESQRDQKQSNKLERLKHLCEPASLFLENAVEWIATLIRTSVPSGFLKPLGLTLILNLRTAFCFSPACPIRLLRYEAAGRLTPCQRYLLAHCNLSFTSLLLH